MNQESAINTYNQQYCNKKRQFNNQMNMKYNIVIKKDQLSQVSDRPVVFWSSFISLTVDVFAINPLYGLRTLFAATKE